MRILCCYTNLHPATAAALARWAPDAEFVDVSATAGTYSRTLLEHWTGEDDLVTVEHDIEIHAGVIPAFESCGEPWCTFGYYIFPEPHRGICNYGLGCAKFSAQMQRDIDFSRVLTEECPACHFRHIGWQGIDNRLRALAGERGLSPHVHGEVAHHHVYRPRPEAVRVYVETLRRNGIV
jgi:hypothetical protein